MNQHVFPSSAVTSSAGKAPEPAASTISLGTKQAWGLQLLTVIAQLEQDFEGIVRTIAGLGYKEVETMGAFGRDPRYVRSVLDKYGLVSPSMHLMPNPLYDNLMQLTRGEIQLEALMEASACAMAIDRLQDNVAEAVIQAGILGQQYIVLPMIWPHQMTSLKVLKEFCGALDRAGELCAQAGLTFCFHNHSQEFNTVDGCVPYQMILESTNPRTVKLELDVYWAVRAKVDPIRLLAQNPGRYRLCHVKDSTVAGEFASLGKGVIDFPRIVNAAQQAGVSHFYVEYDFPADPLEVTREAIGYLDSLTHAAASTR